MKRILLWLAAVNAVVASVLLLIHVRLGAAGLPANAPAVADALRDRTTVRVSVEYDDEFLREHREDAEDFIERAFALVNLEWQRYRREWFRVDDVRLRGSDGELDATHVLGTFLLRTAERPDTIHVCIVGRQLEVYSDGRSAALVGGLAFRRSDALVVSAPAGVTVELLAYYLFHEIGHLWDAYDLPFAGGETTYGNKSRYTFDIDIGNVQIIDEAGGPQPRSTPRLAPAIIRRKLASARALTRHSSTLARLHDVLLHEPSPSNPAYVRKRNTLLAETNDERIRTLVRDHEISPAEAREETETRRRLARHYWVANEALRAGDEATAARELDAMLELPDDHPNSRMLVGAVQRKIRKSTRGESQVR